MTHAESPSRPPTLYAADVSLRGAGEVLSLDEDETRHVRALRLTPGVRIRLTDGAGALWDARLTALGGRSADCVLDAPSAAAPGLPVELVFAVGNKTHVLWLVEKATELGVGSLRPLEAARSLSVADAGRSPAFWAKAQRRALAAMKQSGGAWLPVLELPERVDDYVERVAASGEGEGTSRVRLDGSGEGLRMVLESWSGAGPLAMVVGPEGGWSGAEAERFDDAGFRKASLGGLVLRFETAAIAGLAVVAQQILSGGRGSQEPPAGGTGG